MGNDLIRREAAIDVIENMIFEVGLPQSHWL